MVHPNVVGHPIVGQIALGSIVVLETIVAQETTVVQNQIQRMV